jgi:O-antigen ligase
MRRAAADEVEYPFQRTLYRLVYVGSVCLATMHGREVWRALSRNPFILALVAFGLASVLWSTAPMISAQRSVSLVATTALGAYLGTRNPLSGLLDLLAWILGFTVVLSVGLAIGAPELGVQSTSQGVVGWRGIFTHKNTLGAVATLGALVFMLKWKGGGRHRWITGACLALSAVAVVMSRAVTALVVTASCLLLLPLLGSLRLRPGVRIRLMFAVLFAGAAAAMWLLAYSEVVFGALGRGSTLTGRTTMWPVILDVASDRLWLGHGYAAFWLGWEGPSAAVWQSLGWLTPHSHNGYLDLMLELGVVGVTIFALGLAVSLQRSVQLVRSTADSASLWPVVFLAFLVLQNVPESALLNTRTTGAFYWVLFVATACAVSVRREPTAEPEGVPSRALSPGIRRWHRSAGRAWGQRAGVGRPR